MGHGEIKDYKEEIMQKLQESGIENSEILEPYIENVTQIIYLLQSEQGNKYNESLPKLTAGLLAIYSQIDQQYPDKTRDKEKHAIKDIIESILISGDKMGAVVALRINAAQNAFPLYKKVTKAFQEATGQTNMTEMEDSIATLSLKINNVDNLSKSTSPFYAALKTEAESFFAQFKDDKAVQKFVEEISKIRECSEQAGKTIQAAAGLRMNEIREEKMQKMKETEKELSFKDEGALAAYLGSADAKTLALNLDRNMRSNNVVLDTALETGLKVYELFPKAATDKMQEVGKELMQRQEGRSTFVGKVKQKAKDYVAIVINAFSKLVGKKTDDPKLDAALKEYNIKMKDIEKYLAASAEHSDTKQSGKFVGQVLVAQQGKGEGGQERK